MNLGDVDHLHYEEYPQVRQHIVLPEAAEGVSQAPYGAETVNYTACPMCLKLA